MSKFVGMNISSDFEIHNPSSAYMEFMRKVSLAYNEYMAKWDDAPSGIVLEDKYQVFKGGKLFGMDVMISHDMAPDEIKLIAR